MFIIFTKTTKSVDYSKISGLTIHFQQLGRKCSYIKCRYEDLIRLTKKILRGG
ncbi:MAG: hypothetical protein K0S31_2918 [Sphingobacterium multivorum]|jgi:hypothetical protein|nr:hypothetical protein [Sphingobacterium multivorum]